MIRALPAALLLAAIALPAAAQTAADKAAPDRFGTVSTSASATKRLPNTVADIRVGVEVHARDVPGASAALAQRTKALLTYLQTQPTQRLRTEDVALEPETESVPGKPDRITGYTGRTAVSFRITPDIMPGVLAGCLDNGANALQDVRFAPTEEELQAARQDLATQATRTALAEARAVAEAAGQHVVRIQSIQVDAPQGPVFRPLAMPAPAMRAMKAAAPVPALPGDQALSVSVALQVRIDG
jgi:uncharacterized protein YggE